MEKAPITVEGLKKLQEELKDLKDNKRPKVVASYDHGQISLHWNNDSEFDKDVGFKVAKDKKDDPANINAIMHDVLVAPNNDNLKVSLLRLFWKNDKSKAPTTPREAASVAVAIPA